MSIKVTIRKYAKKRRSKEIVDSILEATTRLIDSNDFGGVSTNKIAKIAGVSIGSLYQYFTTKESIINLLVQSKLDKYFEEFRQQLSKSVADHPDDFESFLKEVLELVVEKFNSNIELRKVYLKWFPRGLLDIPHRVENEIQWALVDFIRENYPSYAHEDLDQRVFVCVHSVVGVLHATLYPNRDFDLEVLQTLLLNNCLNILDQKS